MPGAYVPSAVDATKPADNDWALYGAAELRAIKAYIQTLNDAAAAASASAAAASAAAASASATSAAAAAALLAANTLLQYCGLASGTADALAVSPPTAITLYKEGQEYTFKASATNTGASTIAVSGLVPLAIEVNGVATIAGDIVAGNYYKVLVDSTLAACQLYPIEVPLLRAGGNLLGAIVASGAGVFQGPVTGDVTGNLKGEDAGLIHTVGASVASNALTLSFTAKYLYFRNATLTSGTPNLRTINATKTLVVSSGSTLGTVANTSARLLILALDDAGTIDIGVVNLSGGVALDEAGVISTTAEGGAGAADSANVVYSNTAHTNVPYRILGFVDISEVAPGTWATAPTAVNGASDKTLASISGIGIGQTWQDVTASRAAGTTYYNTTGKPILVNISTASGTLGTLTVNGVVTTKQTGNSNSSGITTSGSAIVPPGGSYVFNTSFAIWAELR